MSKRCFPFPLSLKLFLILGPQGGASAGAGNALDLALGTRMSSVWGG